MTGLKNNVFIFNNYWEIEEKAQSSIAKMRSDLGGNVIRTEISIRVIEENERKVDGSGKLEYCQDPQSLSISKAMKGSS